MCLKRFIKVFQPVMISAFALVLVSATAGYAQSSSDLQVEDVVRQLKPQQQLPKGVRTRGLPTRGVSVELPGGAGTSTDGETTQKAPTINLSIEFEFNSHALTAKGKDALKILGQALASKDLADFRFLIAGHTDAVGGDGYNQILSELRAKTVKEFLTTNHGVGAGRLVAKGFGESKLLDPSKPDASINRRVQVTNLGEN